MADRHAGGRVRAAGAGEGGTPSQRTDFRVAYDATTLYVRVRAFDAEPDKIVTYLTRRDDDSPSDWIRVLHRLVPRSANGVRVRGQSGRRQAGSLLVQRQQPRRQLGRGLGRAASRATATAGPRSFGFRFRSCASIPDRRRRSASRWSREIGRLNETSTWPLLARSATGYVSSFGDLSGLSMLGVAQASRGAAVPGGGADAQPTDGNPLMKGSVPEAPLGLDLKYALTPGLTLTATINPDFGQVEADPAVVNLSAFETFFNERRPFFVEGSGQFQVRLDCANGRADVLHAADRTVAAGADDLPSGDDVYTDAPAQTTILGAAKLTGRVGRFRSARCTR